MNFSNRTKRRKVNQAVDKILASLENAVNEGTKIGDTTITSVVTVDNLNINPSSSSVFHIPQIGNAAENIMVHTDGTSEIVTVSETYVDCNKEELSFGIENELDSAENDSEYDSADDGSEYDRNDKPDVRNKLHVWATLFGISQVALTALLYILWLAGLDVPKDARTLLQTPDDIQLKPIPGGNYYHCGIKNGIIESIKRNSSHVWENVISLNLNIDGLLLFHSSNVQLWPILGYLAELPRTDVLIIGLYSGSSKPLSLNNYLEDFITEMKDLITNGFAYLDNNFSVRIKALICDAPARSYIKCIKGHCGYNACERCVQEGVYRDRVMTFPEFNAQRRTDDDFCVQRDEDHHLARTPLLELNIGLISQFPLDYMHLICLGVIRRLVSRWIEGDPQYKLPSRMINDISANLIHIRKYIPCEFARRPRSLLEYKQWKATEFRQFLLYTGHVVLRDILPVNMYNNFVTLSVAMMCPLRPDFATNQQYCDYAEKLIVNFVADFATLYGANQLVYNVHSTIHLVQDCRTFGPLDKISAFPFENFLGNMKRMVQRPQNPIAQIVRRCTEKNCVENTYSVNTVAEQEIFSREHFSGPVHKAFHCQSYRNTNILREMAFLFR